MTPTEVLSLFLSLAALYLISRIAYRVDQHEARIKALEQGRKVEATKLHVPEWQKPVENFEPKKPETLRPGEVRGREVNDMVFEFDVKMK